MNPTNYAALVWLHEHSGFARIKALGDEASGYTREGKQSSRRFQAKVWKGLIREDMVARKWVHSSYFELTITAKGKAYLS